MINYSTPKSRATCDKIVALIEERGRSAETIADLLGVNLSTVRNHLRHLVDTGRVRSHGKQRVAITDRNYWIATTAPLDAPCETTDDCDIEEKMNRDAKKKLAQIKPFRDWSAAWIPDRKAA